MDSDLGELEFWGPPEASGSGWLRLGALRLAPQRHEAWVGDQPLALSPREFRLLVELAREPGKVVAKNVLAQRLEPLGDALDAATLEVHVSNLRKKIGAERVVTVRGVGYRLQP